MRPYGKRHNSKRDNLKGRGISSDRHGFVPAVRLVSLSPARGMLSADSVSIVLLASIDAVSKYTYVVAHVKGAVPRARAGDLQPPGCSMESYSKEHGFGALSRARRGIAERAGSVGGRGADR